MLNNDGAIVPLTETSLLAAVEELAARDADLAAVVARFGPPPLWARPPGFPTLIHIILEQQVSLASARAAYDRLLAITASQLTPLRFLELDDVTLHAVGFSRQKAAYGRILAEAVLSGALDFAALENKEDAQVRSALVSIKGIGPWTAEIYLLMVLLRPDAWPRFDLALVQSARVVKGLPAPPTPLEFERLGEPWRPWRAVAARLLWHDYLSRRSG